LARAASPERGNLALTKLLGMAGILLVLMLAIGAISIKSLAAVNTKGGSLYNDRVVPVRGLAQSRALLGDIDSQIQRAITDSTGSNAKFAASAQSLASTAEELNGLVRRFKVSA
jgi:hypothetical protein